MKNPIKKEGDIPNWIFWGTVSGVVLISLGVFLVGKFHSQLGVYSLVGGGISLYVSVISLVFKL